MKLKCLEEIKNRRTKYKYIDDEGYLYSLTVDELMDKRSKGHSRFATYNPYTIDNIKLFLKKSECGTILLSDTYISRKNGKLLWQCKCGNKFMRTWGWMYAGKYHLCNNCIKKIETEHKKYTLDDAIRFCNKYGFTILSDKYIDSKTKLHIRDKNGYEGMSTLSDINEGKHFIIFDKRNPFYYQNLQHTLDLRGYNCKVVFSSVNTYENIELICECGNHYYAIKDQIIAQKPKYRCPKCAKSISNGELAVRDWLKNHNVKFIQQYRFVDCKHIKTLPFDFYLPDKNICIEFDGAFHFYKQKHISEEQFNEQKKRDQIKNEYCQDNNIKLIRIPFWFLYNKKYKNILKDNILT